MDLETRAIDTSEHVFTLTGWASGNAPYCGAI